MAKFRLVIRCTSNAGNEISLINNLVNVLLKKMIEEDGLEFIDGEAKTYILSI